MHLADKKAETDLRRFKARLELINPDLYEDEVEDEDEEAGGPRNEAPQDEDPTGHGRTGRSRLTGDASAT